MQGVQRRRLPRYVQASVPRLKCRASQAHRPVLDWPRVRPASRETCLWVSSRATGALLLRQPPTGT
eukprot:10169324-Lingulodinium_polyedra.AAC.1